MTIATIMTIVTITTIATITIIATINNYPLSQTNEQLHITNRNY